MKATKTAKVLNTIDDRYALSSYGCEILDRVIRKCEPPTNRFDVWNLKSINDGSGFFYSVWRNSWKEGAVQNFREMADIFIYIVKYYN